MWRVISPAVIILSSMLHAQFEGDLANTYATGMVIVGKASVNPSCPLIVWIVSPDSPADHAGIKAGDRLLGIDGHHTTDIEQARPLLHPKDSKPRTLELEGKHGPYSVTVSPIRLTDLLPKDGQKLAPDDSGGVFPIDATEAEMKRVENFDVKRIQQRAFPTHYPENMDLYYPGFEAFVLENPVQIAVGGLEDGPARKAGIHWGDAILSVNGVNPVGKWVPELEDLFTSPGPATIKLVIDRDGATKTITFELAKAADILRENHRQLYKGHIIPSSIPADYLHCWEPKADSK